MNKYAIAALVVAAGIIGGYAGGVLARTPLLGGDFAGGIVPSQLFTANTATNGITPVGNFNYAVGGTAAANQITALFTAVVNYPVSSNLTLGPVTSATSTATTTVAFTAPGFAVGDACNVTYNGVTSTPDAFGADGFVTAVSGNNVSATITLWNGKNGTVTLTPTSSATGVSSTLKSTCFHTGV